MLLVSMHPAAWTVFLWRPHAWASSVSAATLKSACCLPWQLPAAACGFPYCRRLAYAFTCGLSQVFATLEPAGVDLMARMFEYDPAKRISVRPSACIGGSCPSSRFRPV